MNEREDGKLFWMGKPLDSLSQLELIGVIRHLMAELQETRATGTMLVEMVRRRAA